MRGSIRDAASTMQPAKIDSFAQLAKSLAPGYIRRHICLAAKYYVHL